MRKLMKASPDFLKPYGRGGKVRPKVTSELFDYSIATARLIKLGL